MKTNLSEVAYLAGLHDKCNIQRCQPLLSVS